ncbi:hypothetical protein [Flavobacterium coralii]|uniref:hypothetical protein n=1 Tax=Flavobacterium coralii TaxID=2838017 RepID=UPI000C55CA56|nr:hypothetical protein [Flavobacterium sp.]|tara:strand:- start:1792 stop:3084 length:1293 start_codon:yes stop_codon:yes gene_type:complete
MHTLLFDNCLKGTTTWSGGRWSNGLPNGNCDAILNEKYTTAEHGSFTCYNLYIGATELLITANCFIKVLGETVEQDPKAVFTVENDGEFILLNKDVDVATVKATFNRLLTGLKRLDYWFLSSPISGLPVINLSPLTLTSRFYKYNAIDNLYNSIDPRITILEAGSGYLVRTPNNFPSTVSDWQVSINNLTQGTLNSGIIPVRLPKETGYYLIGNPYISRLSVLKFLNINEAKIDNFISVWHKSNNPDNPTYIEITKVTSNRSTWDVNLMPFQAFIINKKKEGDLEIIFTPDMQVLQHDYTEPDKFYLDLLQKDLNIPVSSISYTVEQYPDDFLNLEVETKVLALVADTKLYTIQQVVSWTHIKEIKLFLRPQITAEYFISLSKLEGLFTQQNIFLFDWETGVKHDLKSEPYTIVLEAKMEYRDRFILQFE